MSPYVRRVRTASGAVAVQVAEKIDGKVRVIKHVGSAHTDGELAVLHEIGVRLIRPGQGLLDIDIAPQVSVDDVANWTKKEDQPKKRGRGPGSASGGKTVGSAARLLWEVLQDSYRRLGFDTAIDDDAFEQMVLARLVKPTSKLACIEVLESIGIKPKSYATLKRCLTRINDDDYRERVAQACFSHVLTKGDLSLVLYDVTTLYSSADEEDDLRKVGFSKERRVDPQVVVGLLVDRGGFPLEVGCFQGNMAETLTILPMVRQFQERYDLADVVVVADAGMLSATNLKALEEAGLFFIVGSRQTKAPLDLANHFHWQGNDFSDGDIIDTTTWKRRPVTKGGKDAKTQSILSSPTQPPWDPDTQPNQWRAIWKYSHKRALRERKTLQAQQDRARDIVEGKKSAKRARFVKANSRGQTFDQEAYEKAVSLSGLHGYVTNIPKTIMAPTQVINDYHDLWHVEQSFRITKHDLAAQPMFHHTRDAIEAHLTIVMASLAVSRELYARTGIPTPKLVRQLRKLTTSIVNINGETLEFPPHLNKKDQKLLNSLTATGY